MCIRDRKRPSWTETAEVANPLSRYPKYKRRSLWTPKLGQIACIVTAEDGSWGIGLTTHSGPVMPVINDHFAPLLQGEDCMATEKLWDMMYRFSFPYGPSGIASYAISAVDLALWDLKGKISGLPLSKLLGGFTDKIPVYIAGGYYQEGKGLSDLASEMEEAVQSVSYTHLTLPTSDLV